MHPNRVAQIKATHRGDGPYSVQEVANYFNVSRKLIYDLINSGKLESFTPKWLGSFKRRPKLKIHDPDAKEHELSEQVDRILKKISREGEASLSKKERRVMEQASKRYQKKHR